MIAILPRRRTIADYYELAESRGYTWLGKTLPENTRFCKTKWKCSCGHVWFTTFATIRDGSSCPKCSVRRMADRKRKHRDDYLRLGEAKGYKLVGVCPNKTDIAATWICPNGHKTFKSYNSLRRGNNCQQCNLENRSLKLSDYQAIEQKNGLVFKGRKVPKNVFTVGTWACPNGCTLRKAYRHVRNYAGCPNCPPYRNGKLVSKAQIAIAEMLNGEVNYVIASHRVDIAVVEERIAIEYDGWHWHAHRSAEDRTRNRNIKQAGWKLLVIKSNSRTPTLKQLEFHLTKLRAGESKRVMRLSDWGVGNTIADRRTEPKDER